MKRFFSFSLVLLLVAGIAAPLTARAAEAAVPQDLDVYIQNEFRKTHIPGMSVEIVSADGVLFSGRYGSCADTAAPFILGSISKSFTAVAVMQLAEQGKIDLNRPFATYLPDDSQSSKTTVRQLLNHTSGIKTYSTLENYTCSDTIAPYQYSNVNYGLLGKIVERVSGTDYATYIKTHIFEPLGMEHSYTSLDEANANGLIPGYRNYLGFMLEQEMPYPGGEISGWLNLPSAYLISGADDMGKYLQFYLRGGEGILTAESIAEMTTGGVDVQEGYRYGMGWGQDFRSGEMILTHGGNVENYTTNMQILPERGVAVIVMFNACDYFIGNRMALDLAYNITYRLMGEETAPIRSGGYWQGHLLINAILLAVLVLALLPLLRLRAWRRKASKGVKASSVFFTFLIHLALPTLLLTLFPIVGLPASVIWGFAPDIFLVLAASAAFLYLAGIFKLAYCLRIHGQKV